MSQSPTCFSLEQVWIFSLVLLVIPLFFGRLIIYTLLTIKTQSILYDDELDSMC